MPDYVILIELLSLSIVASLLHFWEWSNSLRREGAAVLIEERLGIFSGMNICNEPREAIISLSFLLRYLNAVNQKSPR